MNKSKSHIQLITGGIRSGKSEYAENIALELAEGKSRCPLYLATAEAYDDEMRRRIELHRQRRADRWDTVEETIDPGKHDLKGRVVLLDCLTLWITNIFLSNGMDIDSSLKLFEEKFARLLDAEADAIIIVTNEIGLGGVPANEVQRKFADLQGLVNQRVASIADKVILMVSGLPLLVK